MQVSRRLAGVALPSAQAPGPPTPPRLRNGRNRLVRKRKGKDLTQHEEVGSAANPQGPPAAVIALGGGLFGAVACAGGSEGSPNPGQTPRLRVVVLEGVYGCVRAVADIAAGAAAGGALAPKAEPNGMRVGGAGALAAGVQAVALGGAAGGLALLANGAVLVAYVEVRAAVFSCQLSSCRQHKSVCKHAIP